MNILEPFNVIFFVGFIVFFWTRHVFINHTKGVKTSVDRMDGLEIVLLSMMVPPSLVLPVLYLFSPLLAFADYGIPLPIRCGGVVLMWASLWLFWRSHSDLGKNWSPSLQLREGHELVTSGVYRFIRHPMYASLWLWAFAQGTLLQNWCAGWSFAIAFAAMYFLRVPREERLMCELFGDEYRSYMRRSGRLFPRLTPS